MEAKEPTRNVLLRLPAPLHTLLKEAARAEERSVNSFIVRTLRAAVGGNES